MGELKIGHWTRTAERPLRFERPDGAVILERGYRAWIPYCPDGAKLPERLSAYHAERAVDELFPYVPPTDAAVQSQAIAEEEPEPEEGPKNSPEEPHHADD